MQIPLCKCFKGACLQVRLKLLIGRFGGLVNALLNIISQDKERLILELGRESSRVHGNL